MAGKFEIFLDAESQYRFRLSTHEGAVIAASRGFADKPAAVAEISDVHQCAGTALIPDPSSPRRPAVQGAESPVGTTNADVNSASRECMGRTEELVHARDRMRGLLSAVISLTEDLSLETLLDRVVQSACELIGARFGALGVIGEDQSLSHFITVGIDEDGIRLLGELPKGHGVLGHLIREPHPLRLHDLREHPLASGFPSNHPPMKTFLGVPVTVRDTVFGNLYLTEKKGGEDFTGEDEDLAVALASAAGVAIENARLFADSRHRHEELTLLAFRDPLTGLANRALFRDRLEHALTAGDRSLTHVLLLDLDDFKEVNDVLGHHAGDEMLIEAGRRLRSCVGQDDTVARLGGDEFVILLTSVSDPAAAAERVVSAMSVPFILHGHELHPSVSLGMTGADSLLHAPDLLRRADIAMYAAKAAGKNCYMRFHPDMMAAVLARNDLETGLRTAVERGEITVHYQPVINTARAAVTQVEALVRWQRPDRIVSPSEFIPAAESSGLIHTIGHEVLSQACTQLRSWLEQSPEHCVAVNVSAVQLRDPGYARTVLETLDATGNKGNQLILEVTESVFLDPAPHITAQLRHLRAHGVRVALDDFGTGYSSLGRLQDLPVDILKIDKSFVSVIITGKEDLPILTSMTVLAHRLGLRITGEGVETPAQARHLLNLGCDSLQGYLFSRPVPPQDLPVAEQHATDRFLEIDTGTLENAAEQSR